MSRRGVGISRPHRLRFVLITQRFRRISFNIGLNHSTFILVVVDNVHSTSDIGSVFGKRNRFRFFNRYFLLMLRIRFLILISILTSVAFPRLHSFHIGVESPRRFGRKSVIPIIRVSADHVLTKLAHPRPWRLIYWWFVVRAKLTLRMPILLRLV